MPSRAELELEFKEMFFFSAMGSFCMACGSEFPYQQKIHAGNSTQLGTQLDDC